MKRHIVFIFWVAFFLMSFVSQKGSTCFDGTYLAKGASFKIGYFNSEGKMTAVKIDSVTAITSSGDSSIATVSTKFNYSDLAGDHLSHVRFICLKNELTLDIAGDYTDLDQSGDLGWKFFAKGNLLSFNSTYVVGEKLDDVHMQLGVISKGHSTPATITDYDFVDRIVDSVADITCAEQTFHCFRIKSTKSIISEIGEKKIISETPHKAIDWFCPSIGIVLSESYNKDGLSSWRKIIEIHKP